MIFASGAIPLDPKSMEVVKGGIEEQTVRPTSPHIIYTTRAIDYSYIITRAKG
jgi:hypothetical protein